MPARFIEGFAVYYDPDCDQRRLLFILLPLTAMSATLLAMRRSASDNLGCADLQFPTLTSTHAGTSAPADQPRLVLTHLQHADDQDDDYQAADLADLLAGGA